MENGNCYCMDCMEGMAQFPDGFFDLAVVDPPYYSGPERRGRRSLTRIWEAEAAESQRTKRILISPALKLIRSIFRQKKSVSLSIRARRAYFMQKLYRKFSHHWRQVVKQEPLPSPLSLWDI